MVEHAARHLRTQWIDRLVNERALTTPAERKAYYDEPFHHNMIEHIRFLVKAAELAMEIEGIPRESRDRVIHTLIFGEPPDSVGVWPDPDAALQRITDREAAFKALAGQPLAFFLDASGNIKRKEDQQ